MADRDTKAGLSPKASLTIALAGIAATLIAATASSWLTGHLQGVQQDKNLAAQANASDKVELRGVVDRAESAILHVQEGLGEGDYAAGFVPNNHELAVARTGLSAMRLPEARLTVRLGASHPITKAYHLSALAFQAEYNCDFLRRVAPRINNKVAKLVTQALDGFNTRVTALLGSAVAPKSGVRIGNDADLQQLAAAIKSLTTSHRACG
jgi:hypothetical protein